MANNEFTIPIPARLKNVAKGGHVAGAKDIIDDAIGKEQSVINQDRIDDIANIKGGSTKSISDLSEDIANEAERASGVEAGLRESIDELGQIGLNPENAISTDGDDFGGDTTAKRSKIPTIGAIIDGNPGVYDVSKRYPTGGPNGDGTFTLEYILENADTLISTSRRHGGMEICFVHSSDNKYLQYFLTKDEWSASEGDWEKMNLEKEVSLLGQELVLFGGVEIDFDAQGYIDKDTGNITSFNNARATSKYYPISTILNYLFTGNKNYSVAPVAYYDKDKNFISGVYSEGAVTYNNQNINTILPIPSNAVYVRFSNWGTTGYAVIGRLDFPKNWIGRKWACLGDSLTENNIRTTLHYFDYIHDLTGIDIANCGSSGTGYANRQYGEQAAFYQRVNTIPIDSDVVTIFGSFNDMGTKKEDGVTPLPLGNINDTDPSESICGAINLTITNILNRIPDCRLGVVTPTPWSGYRPTINGNAPCELYVNAIIDICKLRSIPCLDLFRCSNLRPWEVSFKNIAYSKDGTYTEATSLTPNAIQVTTSNIDAVHLCGLPNAQIGDWVLPSLAGVHPDELGHKIIAPRFKTFIESLFI